MADDDERDFGRTRSGATIVTSIHADTHRRLAALFERQKTRETPVYELGFDLYMGPEWDPLEEEAPRGLFTRDAWSWMWRTLRWSWRNATGVFARAEQESWLLQGVTLAKLRFGVAMAASDERGLVDVRLTG